MVGEDFGGVNVDVCRDGCKGIWFDWFELSKLDQENEGFGGALKEAIESEKINDQDRGQITCPKCKQLMYIHKYKEANKVNVDECYRCSGFFLDSGELQMIRKGFMSEEESADYLQSLLAEVPEYQVQKDDFEKKQIRNAAIVKLTQYIRPSYYMKFFE
tara:strand:- start:1166 stop:1642 length:477 start_codon:yes stop_codon:yes gene_type:complete